MQIDGILPSCATAYFICRTFFWQAGRGSTDGPVRTDHDPFGDARLRSPWGLGAQGKFKLNGETGSGVSNQFSFASKAEPLVDLYIESMHYDHRMVSASFQSKATLLACLLGRSLRDIMSSAGSGKDSTSSMGAGYLAARLATVNDQEHSRFPQ
jgi:hypothetical protein